MFGIDCVKLFGALRASAPVHDLGFVDDEALIVCCCQARGIADGAIDVGEGTAGSADHVVVVVAHPRFVASGRARGFDPAKDPCDHECGKTVVNRLA